MRSFLALRLILLLASGAVALGFPLAAARAGTLVRFHVFQIGAGRFDVELYDSVTPLTVANFLAYVNSGRYQNQMVHRSVPGFVIQGGGYTFNGTAQVEPRNYPTVVTFDPVPNEPFVPTPRNVRGTLAMARPPGQPNGARSQWFINLANNSGSLDSAEGGFTVFGRVLGSGMSVVDAIAALPRFQFEAPWNEAPMRNYTAEEFRAFVPVDGDNVVLLPEVVVMADADGDLVPDDGDESGVTGDQRCGGGQTEGCDDNCPTVANGPNQAGVAGVGHQLDSDLDAVGDACDNCVTRPNAGLAPLAFQTTTGGQLDDDADGWGNACDADFNQLSGIVDSADFALFKAAYGEKRNGSTCSGAPCDKFDLNQAQATIDSLDFAVFKVLFGKTKKTDGDAMDRCSLCGPPYPDPALPCAGDACP